jgi:dolichol-phosphate mannosyltransferase/undecaprenyl-phosphate 4-deoxy-4-formamido-L-arabinose transferase
VLADIDHEIILVNDHSPDAITWPAIADLAAQQANVVGIDLARNTGQFAALMCGLSETRGDFVITMDDDFQHPPDQIPRLISGMDDETDVVIGAYEEKQHGGLRNLGSRVMDRIYRGTYGKPPEVRMGSFRLLRRRVVETMLSFGTVRPVPGALILQSTARIKNVTVEHHPRQEGSSGYSVRRLVSSTLDNIVNASTGPLRAISLLGLVSAAFAVIALAYYLLRALFTDRAVPGFSTTVMLITFFGGATLLAIGVLGEYVVRLVIEAGRPPPYAVRQRVDQRGDPADS